MRQSVKDTAESSLVRSLALMVLVCLLPVQQLRSLTSVMDPDIWWHMRVGHWIIQNRSFPHTGIFSYVGETRPWAAYSWGFETIMAAMNAAYGLRGIVLLTVALDTLIVVALFLILRRLSGSFWWAWLLCFAATWGMNINWVGVGRPVMFSILFFTIELGLIFLAEQTENARFLYWLPLLFLVWSNFHIQFAYGLMPLGLFAVVCAAPTWMRASNAPEQQGPAIQAKTAWVILTASVLATLVNPYGFGLYRVVFGYIGGTFAYSVIQEFHAINFREAAHYVELLLALMAFLAMGRRRIDAYKLTLLIVISIISFRSMRDAWFLCVAAALTIACTVAPPIGGKQREAPLNRLQLAGAFLGAVCLIAIAGWDGGFSERVLAQVVQRTYPAKAVAYIQQHHHPGPLYNNFNWGGFLIGSLPDYSVSIDGRTDVYGEDMLRQEVDSMNGLNLDKDQPLHQANLIILPAAVPLCRVLERSSQYQVVYVDPMAMVFVRKP